MNTVPVSNWVRRGSRFYYPADPNVAYRYRVEVYVEQGSICVDIENDDATYTSGSYCSAEIPVEVIRALLEDL